ncbi:MAG: DEAD/DEAH box helicase [Cytophagaceae bacterium]
MSELKFNELPISDEIIQAVEEMGYETPSPIQEKAIPVIYQGKDVIGQAKTGTGKTAAFGIPLIDMVDPKLKKVQGLIMCPTRELALQVNNEIKKLSKYIKGLKTLPVYGGESIEKQISNLKAGVQIVVGTPGRILDHLERKTIRFDQIKMVVLDEADEMLNMGFREDIEDILNQAPDEKQTILFSATMAKPILELTKKFQNKPELIKVTDDNLTVTAIDQVYYEVRNSEKLDLLSHVIKIHDLKLVVVFCNTKKDVDNLVNELRLTGIKTEGLHGDLRQNQRNEVMAKFRKSQVNVLVATDVAARGIDVEMVDAVVNYDVPQESEFYVHRIGRTGRAGRSGKAFTFVTPSEKYKLREIEKYANIKIEKASPPSVKELVEIKVNSLLQAVSEMAETNMSGYEKLVEQFEEKGISANQLAAGLLKLHIGELKEERKKEYREKEDFGRDRNTRDRNSRGRDGRDNGRGDSRRKKSNAGMVRLFINVGKADKVSKGDILGAITGEASIEGDAIGSIDLYDKFTFVDITEEYANGVIAKMNNQKIKGKKINLEIAKKR